MGQVTVLKVKRGRMLKGYKSIVFGALALGMMLGMMLGMAGCSCP